ncbi:MAG: hypothetical protein WCY77_10135 [Weeksellaceae bacterium]
MSFLDFFRRAVPKVSEFKDEPNGIKVTRKRKGKYICECVLYYEDEPVRRAKFEISAYSRRHAQELIEKNLKIRTSRTYKSK